MAEVSRALKACSLIDLNSLANTVIGFVDLLTLKDCSIYVFLSLSIIYRLNREKDRRP